MHAPEQIGVASVSPDLAHAVRPMRGESVSGDRCALWQRGTQLTLAVADGLGHGPGAAHAAEAAIHCIGTHLDVSCTEIFAACDHALRRTRGVALALAVIDRECNALTLASVGNIRAVLLTAGADLRLGGACGIVGGGFRDLAPETHTLADGDMLCLYTDGFQELLPLRELLLDWRVDAQQHVGTAFSRWAGGHDDAGLLLYRHRHSPGAAGE